MSDNDYNNAPLVRATWDEEDGVPEGYVHVTFRVPDKGRAYSSKDTAEIHFERQDFIRDEEEPRIIRCYEDLFRIDPDSLLGVWDEGMLDGYGFFTAAELKQIGPWAEGYAHFVVVATGGECRAARETHRRAGNR